MELAITEQLIHFLEEKRKANCASKKVISTLYNFYFWKIKKHIISLTQSNMPIVCIFEFLIESGLLPKWFKYHSFYNRIKDLTFNKENFSAFQSPSLSSRKINNANIANNLFEKKPFTKEATVNIPSSWNVNSVTNTAINKDDIEFIEGFEVKDNLGVGYNEKWEDFPDWFPTLNVKGIEGIDYEVLRQEDPRFPWKDTSFKSKTRFLIKDNIIFDSEIIISTENLNKESYMPILKGFKPSDSLYDCYWKDKKGELTRCLMNLWKMPHQIINFCNKNPLKRFIYWTV